LKAVFFNFLFFFFCIAIFSGVSRGVNIRPSGRPKRGGRSFLPAARPLGTLWFVRSTRDPISDLWPPIPRKEPWAVVFQRNCRKNGLPRSRLKMSVRVVDFRFLRGLEIEGMFLRQCRRRFTATGHQGAELRAGRADRDRSLSRRRCLRAPRGYGPILADHSFVTITGGFAVFPPAPQSADGAKSVAPPGHRNN